MTGGILGFDLVNDLLIAIFPSAPSHCLSSRELECGDIARAEVLVDDGPSDSVPDVTE
jgi:hypothetical protein